MTTDPPSPRRKWHLQRWLLLLAAGFLAYGGWTQYAFRAALKEARALGWAVYYTDPYEVIRADWKAAFRKATWLDGVTGVDIPTSEEFEQHLAILHRLNPKELRIMDASTLRDIPKLNGISRLQSVVLIDCTRLTNLDGLKDLSALQKLVLHGCKALTNVDALKSHSALKMIELPECRALTNVDALKNLSALERLDLSGSGLTNVDALKHLGALKSLDLRGCTELINVDGLGNLAALQSLSLGFCTRLTNVDVIKSLPALHEVWLTACTGLPPDNITAQRAVMLKTRIYTD